MQITTAIQHRLAALALAIAAGCASQGPAPALAEHGLKPTADAQLVAPSPAVSAPLAALSASARIDPKPPREPFTLRDDRDRPIEVYPPIGDAPSAPIVVMLHATCMKPALVCDWFGSAARDTGWLICPSGNSTCYGEPDWNGTGSAKADFLERALDLVESKMIPFVDTRPGVLIGWSRGAFAARDILYTSLAEAKYAALSKRFRGLVLIAAQVSPDANKLRAAGIRRVVMAAGDYDGSRPTMTASVAALQKSGISARYVSLGKIGHVWPVDFEARMREHIAWAGVE